MTRSAAAVAQLIEQPADLRAPLAGQQAQVGDDHAHGDAVDVEVDVQRGARLASIDGQIDVPDVQHRAAGQERVAVVTVGAEQGRPGDRVMAQRRREVLHLHGRAGLAGAGVDLLQTDDVGVDLPQHGRDTGRVALAVGADAGMDVVRHDPQPLRWGRRRHRRLAIRRLSHHSAAPIAPATSASTIRLSACGCRTVAPIRSANTVSASTPGRRPIALPST